MDERLPQYLHKPVQVLWFDAEEFVVVLATVFVALMIGGTLGWLLFGSLFLFIPWKRSKPRGYIPHLIYRYGIMHFRNYPRSTQTRFFE